MPTNGWGNIYCNSFSGDTALASGGGFTGLLDEYSGAAAAYSLRQLSSTYAGSAIRVRRSSDNAEQDIGFVSNELDTASLLSFVGANDGFVTTWFDQSGNANDATQSTASNQPQIASAGSLILENGKPAVDFDGINYYLKSSFAAVAQPNTYFVTAQLDTPNTGDYYLLIDSTSAANRNVISHDITNRWNLFAGTNVSALTPSPNDLQHLHTAILNGASSFYYLDGSVILNSVNPGSDSMQGLTIGARLDGLDHFWDGSIQEVVFYNGNKSADRTNIETNVNNFYSIY